MELLDGQTLKQRSASGSFSNEQILALALLEDRRSPLVLI